MEEKLHSPNSLSYRENLFWLKERKILLIDFGSKLLGKVLEIKKSLREIFIKELQIRNKAFAATIEKETKKSRVITISGAGHNSDGSDFIKSVEGKGIPFISLISKISLNVLKIQKENEKKTFSEMPPTVLFFMRESIREFSFNEKSSLGVFQNRYDLFQILEFVLQKELEEHKTEFARIMLHLLGK